MMERLFDKEIMKKLGKEEGELSKNKSIQEEKFLSELYNFLLNPGISDFEREKLQLAKNLLEKHTEYFQVLRRLQITFMSKSVSGELREPFKAFYKTLPERLENEQKKQVFFAVGTFLLPPFPLRP